MLKKFLTDEKQKIALECMKYVQAFYGDSMFGYMEERLRHTIETWPDCEDDITAFWVMDECVGFALGGVSPSAHGLRREDWFSFSVEAGRRFLIEQLRFRPHYEKLRDERNRLSENDELES
jgi:hypothetical protein